MPLAALAAAPAAHAIPLESQAWWYDTRTLSDGQASHAHGGTEFPLYGSVTGSHTFNVVSKIHNEEHGTVVDAVRIQAGYSGGTTLAQDGTDRVCNSHDCTFTTPLTVNFDKVRRGLVEIRVHTHTRRPSGDRNLSTTGWWLYNTRSTATSTTSPDTSSGTLFPAVAARGRWDTATGLQLGYEMALLRSLVPTQPICGRWRFRAQTKPGSGGSAVTSSRIALDPNLHAEPEQPGRTLLEAPGSFGNYVDLDTRTLPDGPHSLVLIARANVSEPLHPEGRLAGVLRVPFTVDNGNPFCLPQPKVEMSWPSGMTVTGMSGTSNDATLDAVVPAGTSRVRYLLDGVQIAEDTSAGDLFDEPANVSAWSDGAHTLVARATTSAGVIDSPPVRFTVDN